jgi:5-methylcytosine-specific restriction endonuclease McrA
MKFCSKCLVNKDTIFFGKRKTSKDGLDYICIICKRLEAKNTYQRLKEKINYKKRIYRQKPEVKLKRALYAKLYKNPNRKNIIIKNRQKYKDNIEYYRKRQKIWRMNNSDKVKVYKKKRKDTTRKLSFIYNINDQKITYRLFDNKCFNCDSIKKLCIDHHYPASKGFGLSLDNAVLLCNSCNSSKNNKLPHEFYSNSKLEQLNYILTIANCSNVGPM